MPKQDSIQALLRRGREHPNRCAFCSEPAEINLDLTTTNDSMTKVEVDVSGLPACNRCLRDFTAFAGNNAVVFPGRRGTRKA